MSGSDNLPGSTTSRRWWGPSVRGIACALALVGVGLLPVPPSTAATSVYVATVITFIPTAVNASGQVAGYGTVPGGEIHAVRWSGGTPLDLGVLPGGDHSEATGINAHGDVVGHSTLSGGLTHAFLWSDGTMTDLGTLPRGATSYATAVNDSRQVTGWSDTTPQGLSYPRPDHAFLWSGGVMTDLGNISATQNFANFSNGNAINASGQVAGWSIDDNFETHAFVSSGSSMIDLGTLGGTESRANGINDAGTVVGHSFTSGDAATHAFRYDGGPMTDLGTLPGQTASSARSINAAGQIVGSSRFSGTPAFLYESGTGMVRLDTLVSGPSWFLKDARAISAAGHILASGSNDTVFGGDFLLTSVPAGPEIDVRQPSSTSLADGTATRSFGTVKVGRRSVAKTFTIRNTGTETLRRLAFTKNGKHASNFLVTAPLRTTLARGAATTFKVTFRPTAKGVRSAAIHIRSNDADENPFDVQLTGTGKR